MAPTPRPAMPKPPRAAPKLPRAPLPKQTGGAHEDKTKRPWRRRKHRKRDDDRGAD